MNISIINIFIRHLFLVSSSDSINSNGKVSSAKALGMEIKLNDELEVEQYKARLRDRISIALDEVEYELSQIMMRENIPPFIQDVSTLSAESLFRAIINSVYLAPEKQLNFSETELGKRNVDAYSLKQDIRTRFPNLANRIIAITEAKAEDIKREFPPYTSPSL